MATLYQAVLPVDNIKVLEEKVTKPWYQRLTCLCKIFAFLRDVTKNKEKFYQVILAAFCFFLRSSHL